MSDKNEQLIVSCYDFEEMTKEAANKREDFVFPPEKCKDKKGHFPLSDAGQARNALARSHQYSSVPPWYSGSSLSSLQAAVRKAVKAKFPSIDVSPPTKKKASQLLREVATKYGQGVMSPAQTATPPQAASPAAAPKADPTAMLNQALLPYGYVIVPGSEVQALPNERYVDVRVQTSNSSRFKNQPNQTQELKKIMDPITMKTMGLETKPLVYS